ncbi:MULTISPECIES: hypothetical protein [Streptomyces]|uniref:Uncharacterized protein n=1 Tax=Streptomyces doudnae TaxID=3075536 RepID=A0ABD5EQ38_9ACTN|nr:MULTISPECIES: hypothetical protein [unclassified Streptomyces]MDT0436738.1 hypothetical protein [Streptomyces sp. DSM 41981]MYQ67455.1 hypothetical protein [Streptomyces sp. SID4950]SCE35261.1 hypothetical protein GA0115242_132615 [Streptomyces sp. SolWspMP-5a-2]
MTGRPPSHPQEQPWDFGFDWVVTCTVDTLLGRVDAMRRVVVSGPGARPNPAAAMRALHAFAMRRDVDELIEFAHRLDYRDAVTVVAVAALRRDILESADIVLRQWDKERDPSGATGHRLTDRVVHDIACQRTVVDVALFIRQCSRAGRTDLTGRTVEAFTAQESGRSHLDKALIYIALRDEGCAEEATDLLHRTLVAIAGERTERREGRSPGEFDDLAGALQHLSPTERILEEWLDTQLREPDRVRATRELAARLITAISAPYTSLVEHVGTRLDYYAVAEICGHLIDWSHHDKAVEIRRHAAARDDFDDLAELIKVWHASTKLGKTTNDLLADIMLQGPPSGDEASDPGRGSPRTLAQIEALHTALTNRRSDAECKRLLRIAAATHTRGRSGVELATLLTKVERPRDRNRAAQRIARDLARRLLDEGADPVLFVDYVRELRAADQADAVHLACKELADPSDAVRARGPASGEHAGRAGGTIGRIGVGLYEAGLPRDGWDLLERYLENESLVGPDDVVRVVATLVGRWAGDEPSPGAAGRQDGVYRQHALLRQDRVFLLRATVGRWSDPVRREAATALLHEQGHPAEGDAVIRSFR